jgi:hypothetical protein
LRDAVEMEWEGIPSTAIVHEALAGSAEAMKRFSKMPDYSFIEIPFPFVPVGGWTEEEVVQLVELMIPEIEARLITPLAGTDRSMSG